MYDLRLGVKYTPSKSTARALHRRMKNEWREARTDMLAKSSGFTRRRRRVMKRAAALQRSPQEIREQRKVVKLGGSPEITPI